ncbi:MAG: hypothetical protein AAFV62_14400, partial [Pseudomonadota bacterium]
MMAPIRWDPADLPKRRFRPDLKTAPTRDPIHGDAAQSVDARAEMPSEVEAYRFVYGKRVLHRDGPVEPGRDHHVTSYSAGLPRSLFPACRPDALGSLERFLDPWQVGAETLSLRPVAVPEGRYVIVQRVLVRTEGGVGREGRTYVQSTALVFKEADWAAHAPALIVQIPAMVPVDPDLTDAAPETERAVVRVSLTAEQPPPNARAAEPMLRAIEQGTDLAGDPTLRGLGFWQGVAALAAALPPSLRPLLSAGYGHKNKTDALLLVRTRSDDDAPESAQRDQPSDATGAQTSPLLTGLARQLDGEWRLPWGTATDAAHALKRLIQEFGLDTTQLALKRFLTEVDAPVIDIPASPERRIALLSRLIAAAQSRRLFHEELPVFGVARTAGLIACATDEGWSTAWSVIERTQPSRFFWSAMLLRDPDYGADGPKPSMALSTLSELSQLLAFDEQVRSALPEGTPTPLDAPAFKRRLAAFALRSVRLLAADPSALLDQDGA